MSPIRSRLLALALLAAPAVAGAQPAPSAPADPPRMIVEIYRIVPGMHAEFLAEVARYDAVNVSVGLPPRQLFVHSEGGDWDFLLLQPAATPPDKAAAFDAAWKKAKLPSGPDFFLAFRRFIASHEDTFVTGPTTAADFLARRTRP